MTGAGTAGVTVAGSDGEQVLNELVRTQNDAAMALYGAGGAPGRAGDRPVHPRQWQMCAQLPMQLVVTVPLPAVSLQVLTNLRPGQVLLSSWPSREDVPLLIGDVFLANVTFEAAGLHLGVRISGFDKRGPAGGGNAAPTLPRTRLVAESGLAAATDRDHTMNDIVLPTSLCFGMKTMTVQQIQDLTSGDAIVLDRTINAPVSMLASGRIVAQGELVSVKGCFGIRLATLAELSKRLPFFHSALG